MSRDDLYKLIRSAVPDQIMACQVCGQKNRVDPGRVLADAVRPKCGKCGGFIRGPQWDSTEGGPPPKGNPQ